MAEKSPERQNLYQVAKNFKGLNTKANRTAIDAEEFSWLENMMPIGFGNLKTVPQVSNVVAATGGNVTWANTVTSLQSLNINNSDYLMAFEQNGGAEFYNLTSNVKGTISAAGKFSSANVAATQWKNERAVIIDPANGYFTWDGNNVVSIGSLGPVGVTNPGAGYTDIPSVVISAPDDPNGMQATATAVVGQNVGTVQELAVTNQGVGYAYVPNVTISAPQLPSGIQAVATATILGNAVVALNLVSPGSGYTLPPTVTISGGGSTVGNVATGKAVLVTSPLQSISLVNPGTGYSKPPTITIVGGNPTNQATVQGGVINFSTGTLSLLVQNGGGGYTNPANITITVTGGSPSNLATAVAGLRGDQIGSLIMTNPGAGYQSVPSVAIAGGGGSNATATAIVSSQAPTDIATFSGRVWISQGRVAFFTAADSYNDLASVSAGNFEITDTTLHSNIKGLLSANNFLYLFGDDSINVFSDVRVQSDGTTVFTNTNVSASVGTRFKNSIFPYYRTVLFMNDYGAFALVGATTTKLSDPLDGIVPLIDFTNPITAGQVLVNNILCAAFNFTYDDPNQGARQLQAVFFDKKWFLTSQNQVNLVTNVPLGRQNLYGTDGIALFQMYANSSIAINTMTQSALWPLSDPIRTKQALKYGVEAILTTATGMTVAVDSEQALTQGTVSPATSTVNPFTWTNGSAQPFNWVNQSGLPFSWVSGGQNVSGYFLFKGDAQQYGKYIGLTVTSNSGAMTIATLELGHKLGVRF